MARTKKVAARKRTAPKKAATREARSSRGRGVGIDTGALTLAVLRAMMVDHGQATAYAQVVGNAVMGFVVAGMNDPREIATQAIGIADAVVEVAEENFRKAARASVVPQGDVIDITAGEGVLEDDDADFAEPETDIQ